MKVLGITGGVGAGKSTVLSYMEERYHARVLMADQVGRMLQQKGNACYEQIVNTFGTEILQEDGELNRPLLAKLVFSDEMKLQMLNGIVHPAVRAYIEEQIQLSAADDKQLSRFSFIVIESAILLEVGYQELCDSIWYIHTDAEVRIRRLMASRGYTEEKARSIMSNQLPDDVYRNKCDYVIDNSMEIVENTYGQIDKGLIKYGFL